MLHSMPYIPCKVQVAYSCEKRELVALQTDTAHQMEAHVETTPTPTSCRCKGPFSLVGPAKVLQYHQGPIIAVLVVYKDMLLCFI